MTYDPEFSIQLEKTIEETKKLTQGFSQNNPDSVFNGLFELTDRCLEMIVDLKNDYDNSFDLNEKEEYKKMIMQLLETVKKGTDTLLGENRNVYDF